MSRLWQVFAALLCLAWTGPVSAQDELFADLHLYNLRVEWEDAFFRAWDRADDAERERLVALFEDFRADGMPQDSGPLWGTLAVANQVARGASAEDYLTAEAAAVVALQALSADLRVVPGAFAVNGPDDPPVRTVVHVAPVFALSAARNVTARLIWVGPDGAETVAREEPVAGEAFFGYAGFEMYVRAPRSEPALWSLVLELEDPVTGIARSLPVPVPCVADLAPAFAPAQLLVEGGWRVLGGLERTAQEWITAWALGQPLASPERPRRRGALVLAATDDLWPAPLFAGLRGERWRQALDFEFYGALPGGEVSFEGEFTPSSDSVRSVLARLPDDEPRVLVLRGSAIVQHQLEALRFGPPAVDAIVIVATDWRPAVNFPEVPTLVLTPSAQTRAALESLERPGLVVELLESSLFLAELELPERVAAFVAAHVLSGEGD